MTGLRSALAALGVVALCAFSALGCAQPEPGSSEAPVEDAPSAPSIVVQPPVMERVVPSTRGAMMMSLAPVAEAAAPAVVNVFATRFASGGRNRVYDDPAMRRYGEGLRGIEPERAAQSLGSGVIVRADGIVVTNNHVVQGADALRIVMSDRREFEATLVLADPLTDLAVLRIQGGEEPFQVLPFADTRGVKVGDMVLAIGNPFGLSQTVTSGIISALARTEVGVSDFSFFIQTDAAINRGNSGGALVDMTGALVGVNTAIFSESGGSNGIGFAIPAEMVRRVVESALDDGVVVRPWLGVRVQAVNAANARSFGLTRPTGVVVAEVYPGAAADQAGLRAGDVILLVAGAEVMNDNGLRYQYATHAPGDTVPLTVRRDGQNMDVATIAAAPPDWEADQRVLSGRHPLSGAVVISLSPAAAEQEGLDPFLSGVVVTSTAQPRADLRRGDIVRSVNGVAVRTTAELERALRSGRGDGWRVEIERGGERQPFVY
jgi:Do/DeqQ family serine protease